MTRQPHPNNHEHQVTSVPWLQRCLSMILALSAVLMFHQSTMGQPAPSIGSSVAGASPDFEILDHVIDADLLTEVCDSMHLSDAQRKAVTRAFDPYFAQIVGIETGMRARIDAIYQTESGEPPPDSHTQQERIIARANLNADAALSEFYVGIESFLTEAQLSQLESTKRMVRRRNKLGNKASPNQARFSRRLDLRAVFMAWPEFADIADRDDARTLEVLESVETTLSGFDVEIDQYLRNRELRRRLVDGKYALTICEFRRILDRYSSEIVVALEGGLGPDVARSWQLYFWRTQDDLFFKPLPLDDFLEWLEEVEPPTEEMRAALVSTFNDYVLTLRERRARLYATVTPVWCVGEGLFGTGQPQIAFARALAAMLEHHQATIDRMAGLLSPARAAMLRSQFEDRFLVPTMRSALDVHVCVVAGLIDPGTYVAHAWNRETQQYESVRLVKDPVTGIWRYPKDGREPGAGN